MATQVRLQDSGSSGWIRVGSEDHLVSATYFADLKHFIVRDLCRNRWKDYDLDELQLQAQEEGQWTVPSLKDEVTWSTELSLPVRILPLVDKPGHPAMEHEHTARVDSFAPSFEEFHGNQYAKITLRQLIASPAIIDPEFMLSIPAASNYLMEARFGPRGNLIRSIVEVRPRFATSRTCLRDHLSSKNVTPDCALLVDPSWLQ
eukprot:m.920037 g.920037  ORF g.920037 m.920037 type:complete len:203 (+) comp60866_c0_seq1:82-690(+)